MLRGVSQGVPLLPLIFNVAIDHLYHVLCGQDLKEPLNKNEAVIKSYGPQSLQEIRLSQHTRVRQREL